MTLCPYALMIGCEKCPILKVCPLKSVVGNQPKQVNEVGKVPMSEEK